ncbi:MAG: septum formation initiator family protein [Bacteroidota bacterium]
MKYLKKFKYLITLTLFFSWMLIFDSNNIIKQVEYLNTLSKIEQEREYYLNEIKENQSSTNELISNIDKLERYAREKYLMKRENEDVFLIIDEADYTKDGEAKKEKK